MSRPTFMTIDLDALCHNLAQVRRLAPNRLIIAMVKANAYGHGIQRVAEALGQADALGVASVDEGIQLREAGVTRPIVLMEGLFHADELAEVEHHRFSLVVHHAAHVDMLVRARMTHPIAVWLKINTGMHRLGFAPAEVASVYQRLSDCPAVIKPIGLMTHFAEADNADSAATDSQLAIFKEVTQGLVGPRSMANSAAILQYPHTHGDWVRPGLMLYGATPLKWCTGLDHQLQPVMTLSSRLIAINTVRKGAKVGYGGTWTAPQDTLVGVVGVGYGDGYPQYAQNGTPILVNNSLCELVGRVSMDMLTVDLSHCPQAAINDPVVLWGNGLPVERVAHHNHTSAYEILTRMTPRPKVNVLEVVRATGIEDKKKRSVDLE